MVFVYVFLSKDMIITQFFSSTRFLYTFLMFFFSRYRNISLFYGMEITSYGLYR